MFDLLIGVIISAISPLSPPSATSDFASNPLVDIVIGGVIATVSSLLGVFLTNRQQLRREKEAYNRQIEREQVAYQRTLKDAKRERLRNANKVVLNAAEEYEAAIHQISVIMQGETEETRNKRLNASLRNALTGLNQAMIEITLEDVGVDVKTIFRELRQAFTSYTLSLDSNKQVSGTFSQQELDKDKNIVISKAKELTTAMQTHLKELES